MNTIEEIVEFYKSLPVQGSAGWLEGRSTRLGGSELGTLLGYNKYNSIDDLICTKLGIGKPVDQDSINLNWGNFFEPIHTEILDIILNTQINQLPSIPWHSGANKLTSSNLHISPDGIAYLNKYHILRLIDHIEGDRVNLNTLKHYINVHTGDQLVTVMEQKACISRTPTSIPNYYIPQIMGGMNLFNITKLGLFTQSEFRFCEVKDIAPNNLKHRSINNQDAYHAPFTKVLAAGITYIIGDKHHEIITVPNCEEFIKIARTLKCGNTLSMKTIYYDMESENDEFQQRCVDFINENNNVVAMVPWKLFNMTYNFLIPNHNYLDTIEPIIDIFITGIKDVKSTPKEHVPKISKKIKEYLIESLINTSPV